VKEILVVDSNLAVRKLMEFALSREGFEVSAFPDGLSGLDAAFKTPPTLFVVDYRMDGMTLNQFLEKIRQRENLKRIPVVLMISSGDQYDEVKMRSMGIVDIIKKPLDPIEVLEKIKVHASADEMDTIVTAIEPPPTQPAKKHVEPSVEPDDEMVKIEELLGWSSSTEESPFSETAEIRSEDGQKENVEALKATDSSFNLQEEESATGKEELILFEEEELKETQLNEASFAAVSSANLSARALPPSEEEMISTPSQKTVKEMDQPVQTSSPPNLAQVEGITRQVVEEVVHKIAQEMVEKVAWEVIPSLAEITIKKSVGNLQSQAPQTVSVQKIIPPNTSEMEALTEQVVKETVQKIAQEMVEKVAWEVIPSLAEIVLKKEIGHLKGNT
jgi:DNA-binding response OmpR family regulator